MLEQSKICLFSLLTDFYKVESVVFLTVLPIDSKCYIVGDESYERIY